MGDKWKEKTLNVWPLMRGPVALSCYVGHFAGMGPFVPLEGQRTSDEYKVVLSDHLYLMKYFCPDRSSLFQDEHENNVNHVLWALSVTRSHSSWTPVGDFGLTMLFTTVIKTSNEEVIRWFPKLKYFFEKYDFFLQNITHAPLSWKCATGSEISGDVLLLLFPECD